MRNLLILYVVVIIGILVLKWATFCTKTRHKPTLLGPKQLEYNPIKLPEIATSVKYIIGVPTVYRENTEADYLLNTLSELSAKLTDAQRKSRTLTAVSYTHLTLPTIYSV